MPDLPPLPSVQPPDQFNGDPTHWKAWSSRYQLYRAAAMLDQQNERYQISNLLYSLGPCVSDLLTTLEISATPQAADTYAAVYQKIDAHFTGNKNVIFERAQFNVRSQLPGESVESFITSVCTLAETCDYGAKKKELIRDRLVVGISNKALSKELQLEANLTLDTTIKRLKQSSQVERETEVLANNLESVMQVKYGEAKFKSRSKSRSQSGYKNKRQESHNCNALSKGQCHKCGNSPKHSYSNCSANKVKCSNCNKQGHFSKVCRFRKQVHNVQESECSDSDSDSDASEVSKKSDTKFLGFVGSVKTSVTPWKVTLKVHGKPVTFELDSGADVSVMGEVEVKNICIPNFMPLNKHLKGPGNLEIAVLGKTKVELEWKGYKHVETVYVIKGTQEPLLSRTACLNLNLLIPQFLAVQMKPEEEFNQVLQGTGELQGAYTINLKEGAVPDAVPCPRRIPIPQREEAVKELRLLEEQGVISKVDRPAEWCALLVTVPKPNGKVRIIIDSTKLNKFIERECFVKPSVDESLALLGNAKIFSKLDCNKGYFQVCLAQNSKVLTTFINPIGRYYFDRFPMGLASASQPDLEPDRQPDPEPDHRPDPEPDQRPDLAGPQAEPDPAEVPRQHGIAQQPGTDVVRTVSRSGRESRMPGHLAKNYEVGVK